MNQEKKKVLIDIKTVQRINGEDEITRRQVKGTLEGDENLYTLVYPEGGEIRGETSLEYSGMIYLTRKKSLFDMEFYLEAGRLNECTYFTPYGELYLKAHTNYIENNINAHGGTLEFEYNLYYETGEKTVMTVYITVSEEKDV